LLAGRLDASARSQVEAEIGRCRRCAALVAEVARGGSMLHVEPDHTPAPDDARRVDGPPDEPGDDRVARYLLGDEIARGGMATILGAFDRRLTRSIAIKRLERDDSSLAARFAREIRITASLQHPGIVPVYDSGSLPDGQPFYAMRHVQGATLEQAILECHTDRDRLGLVVPVLAAAEAVAYAHERGIIHRDLKPSNILVGPFGETVVIDWGLARIDGGPLDDAPGAEPADDPLTTSWGSILGTPRYMAPEQARGEPATRRSDVYALGAILYHVLAGAPPVAGDDVHAILERAARAEVRPLAEAAPGLPGDLIAIVQRAMAIEPERRYASAGELAADLRRFQTGQLVGAYSYSRGDLARRFVRRHRGAVALTALFTLFLALGAALSFRRIVAESEQAKMERARAERERHGAEDLVQFLLHDLREKLSTLGRLDVLSGVADRVDAYYMATAAGRAELPEAVSERAALYDLRAAVATGAGDGAATDRLVEQGLALVERVPPTARSTEIRAELLGSKAARAMTAGDLDRARALYLESVALYRQGWSTSAEERQQRDVKLARRLTGAAKVADRLGNATDAEREWKEAAEILQRVRAVDRTDADAALRLAEIELAAGQSRYRRGLLREAKESLLSALAHGEELRANDPKNDRVNYVVAWTYLSLGSIHDADEQRADALHRREQAREVALAMVANEPASAIWQSTLARTESDLGMMALNRRDWADAVKWLTRSRTVYEQIVARDPKSREQRRFAAVATAQLADAQVELGHFDAARTAWEAALGHLEKLAASNAVPARLEWAYGLRGLAVLERRTGRLAAAGESIARAVRLVDETPAERDRPVDTYYRAAVLAEAGTVRAAHHRRADAEAAWQRSADLLRGLAARTSLLPDWAQQLKEVEAALSRGRRVGAR
jgi:tetratricopeptide (TPR) repeat protein